jgi:hypothetical protein
MNPFYEVLFFWAIWLLLFAIVIELATIIVDLGKIIKKGDK